MFETSKLLVAFKYPLRGMRSGIHMTVQVSLSQEFWMHADTCQDDMSKVTMEERDDVTLAASMVKYF